MKKLLSLSTLLFLTFVCAFAQDDVSKSFNRINGLLKKARTINQTVSLSDDHAYFIVKEKSGNITCISKIPFDQIVKIETGSFSSTQIEDRFYITLYTNASNINSTCSGNTTTSKSLVLTLKYKNDCNSVKQEIEKLISQVKKLPPSTNEVKEEELTIPSDIDYSEFHGNYYGFPYEFSKGLLEDQPIEVSFTQKDHLSVKVNQGRWISYCDKQIEFERFSEGARSSTYHFKSMESDSKYSKFEFSKISDFIKNSLGFGTHMLSLSNDKESVIVVLNKDSRMAIKSVRNLLSQTLEKAEVIVSNSDYLFGGYQIDWYPRLKKGILYFDHLKNDFVIQQVGSKIYVEDMSNVIPCIKLEFELKESLLRLLKVEKGNPFVNKDMIKGLKNQQAASSISDALKIISKGMDSLIKTKFRPEGKYTITKSDPLNGQGIYLFSPSGEAVSYIGNFMDGKFDGNGKLVYENGFMEGQFSKGIKNGYFTLSLNGETTEGKYIDGVQDGIFIATNKARDTFETTYNMGKKISSVQTNKGDKKSGFVDHLKNANFNISGYGETTKDIASLLKQSNQQLQSVESASDMSSFKLSFNPIKYKIDALLNGVNAAQSDVKKAIKYLEKYGCKQSIAPIKEGEKHLEKARDNLASAWKEYDRVELVNDKETFAEFISASSDYLTAAIKSLNTFQLKIQKVPSCFEDLNRKVYKAPPLSDIGLQIRHDKDITHIKVTGVRSGSAADRVGIRKGDIIIRANDTEVFGLLDQQISEFFKGRTGKFAEVTYYSNTSDRIKKVKLEIGQTGSYEILEEKPGTVKVSQAKVADYTYTGSLKFTRAHGKGIANYSNGAHFEGEFRFNRPYKGKFTFEDGAIYEGLIINNKFEGKGKYTFPNGTSQEGNYVKGNKEGIFDVIIGKRRFDITYKNNKEIKRIETTKSPIEPSSTKKINQSNSTTQDKPVSKPPPRNKDLPISQVGIKLDNNYRITNTLPEFAARKARIWESDILLAVDGITRYEATKKKISLKGMLEGPEGSKVTVRVRKKSNGKIQEYQLTRGKGGSYKKVTPAPGSKEMLDLEDAELIPCGLQVTLKENRIYITGIEKKSPASKYTFHKGDTIIKVGKKVISKDDYKNIDQLLRGTFGKKLWITIKRNDEEDEKKIGVKF